MEIVLSSLEYINGKMYVPWKQIAGAIVSAMLVAALCISAVRGNSFEEDTEKAVTGSIPDESKNGIGNRSEDGSGIRSSLQELEFMREEKRHDCMEGMLDDFAENAGKKDMNAEKSISGKSADTLSAENVPGKSMMRVDKSNGVGKANGASESNKAANISGIPDHTTSIENGEHDGTVTEVKPIVDGKDNTTSDSGEGTSESGAAEETPAEETPTVVSRFEVELYGNGGTPECRRDTCEVNGFDITKYEEPAKPGKMFDGWYLDSACTMPFDAPSEDAETLKLYAGWKEFPGFLSNDKGYIIGYSDASKIVKDNLLVLPSHKSCVGIEKNALNGLEDEISEIYIPANITHIETGLFEKLANLIYIQVEKGNPKFYSEDGMLYRKGGELFAKPKGLE